MCESSRNNAKGFTEGGLVVTEDQIKHLVDRFLGWKLPSNFCPDAGISFKAEFNEHTDHPMRHEPTGTNLFDVVQATEMVRYMAEGMPTERHSPAGNGDRPGWLNQLIDDTYFLENAATVENGTNAQEITEHNDRVNLAARGLRAHLVFPTDPRSQPATPSESAKTVAWLVESKHGSEVFLFKENAERCADFKRGTITELIRAHSQPETATEDDVLSILYHNIEEDGGYRGCARALLSKFNITRKA